MKFDTAALLAALPHLAGGLLTTVYLVVVALLIGASIGLITCAGRLIGHGPLAWLAKGYVDMFRGLPETILIFWVYFCGPFVLDVRLSAAMPRRHSASRSSLCLPSSSAHRLSASCFRRFSVT
jgi:His/Glu/Gln/Arg/opine family amino acid ABC transporter permease subunit